jgi:hypothetical protein
MKALVPAVVLLWTLPAIAGSGPAELSCVAKSGHHALTLKGLVPGLEKTTELILSDGIASLKISDDDQDTHQIEAFENGVYSLFVERKSAYGTLRLIAIPKTVKVKRKPNSVYAVFDAFLDAPNPQSKGAVRSAADMISHVKLSCTYDYKV